MNWYRRHRAVDRLHRAVVDQAVAVKRWDEIWRECPKPLDEHQDELMAIMVRWEVMTAQDLKERLGLEQSQILKIQQMADSKPKDIHTVTSRYSTSQRGRSDIPPLGFEPLMFED